MVSYIVCSEICLGDELKYKINSWSYNIMSRLCSCTWTRTDVCIEDNNSPNGLTEIEDPNDKSLTSLVITKFFQVSKILECRESASNFCFHVLHLITSISHLDCFVNNKILTKDQDSAGIFTSPWHCKLGCEQSPDCDYFSFDTTGKYRSCRAMSFLLCFQYHQAKKTAFSQRLQWLLTNQEH